MQQLCKPCAHACAHAAMTYHGSSMRAKTLVSPVATKGCPEDLFWSGARTPSKALKAFARLRARPGALQGPPPPLRLTSSRAFFAASAALKACGGVPAAAAQAHIIFRWRKKRNKYNEQEKVSSTGAEGQRTPWAGQGGEPERHPPHPSPKKKKHKHAHAGGSCRAARAAPTPPLSLPRPLLTPPLLPLCPGANPCSQPPSPSPHRGRGETQGTQALSTLAQGLLLPPSRQCCSRAAVPQCCSRAAVPQCCSRAAVPQLPAHPPAAPSLAQCRAPLPPLKGQEQNKTKQNKTKQNKTKQNKNKQKIPPPTCSALPSTALSVAGSISSASAASGPTTPSTSRRTCSAV